MAAKETDEIPVDPVTSKSFLWPIVAWTVALLLATCWAFYDEAVIRRPWKKYQAEWLEVAREAYSRKLPTASAGQAKVKETEEFKRLQAEWRAAEAAIKDQVQALNDRVREVILPQIAIIDGTLREIKSRVAEQKYKVETAGHDSKERERRKLEKLKTTKHKLRFDQETVEWDYTQMMAAFNALKAEQGQIQGAIGTLRRESGADAKRKAVSTYRDLHLPGDDPVSIEKLVASLDTFDVEIKQIHIKKGDLVDRCESCHLGIRSPIELTLADVNGKKVYTSHPNTELLDIHDPEQFGCSLCHGGAGVAVDSVKKAHGKHKHWLWPLFDEENVEGGCVQCHKNDIWLDHAQGYGMEDTGFNKGKWLYHWRGCSSCHKYEGFDKEQLALKELGQRRSALLKEKARLDVETAKIDPEGEDAQKEKALAAQRAYLLEKELTSIAQQAKEVKLELKYSGPNLREVKKKLKPEWLAGWIFNPKAFRPNTRMPQFRISEEEAWDMAAYLWSVADDGAVPERTEGDAEEGMTTFASRGCLACHQAYFPEEDIFVPELPEGEHSFAADLSRVGEKANQSYLASWVQNPRQHNAHTVMPSFRLSDDDADNIAAWFAEVCKDPEAKYGSSADALAKLNDSKRWERGQKLVKHFGCNACHQIADMPVGRDAQVGTELTKEGSKPLERLDFGLLTHDAERNHWYDHKGFITRKLRKPEIWDEGKEIESRWDALKMPNLGLAEHEIQAITTFLLGSVESRVPEHLLYQPDDYRKDLQEGWWLVKKYNCDSCHQILPGKTPLLWTLPWYDDFGDVELDGVPKANGRPPTLVGEGSRVDPAWLSNFLNNPALTQDPELFHRNGVRQGLSVRMPTYEFSESERGKLVRFFTALARLSKDYVRADDNKLAGEELEVARAAFVAGNCANCHLLGGETEIDPASIFAPSFEPVAHRIRAEWHYQWITDPQSVIPGTGMPAKLDRRDNGTWKMQAPDVTSAKRLTDREKKLLDDPKYDHAEMLTRYFAHWDEIEAEFQKKKREIR